MHTFHKAVTVSLAATFAFSSAATTGDAQVSLESVPARMMSIASSRVPPPQEGLRLLEDIFARMHNYMPQLAMAKTKVLGSMQQQQAQPQQQAMSQAINIASAQSTDPMLAIKPPKKSKASRRSQQQIAMAYSNEKTSYAADDMLADKSLKRDENARKLEIASNAGVPKDLRAAAEPAERAYKHVAAKPSAAPRELDEESSQAAQSAAAGGGGGDRDGFASMPQANMGARVRDARLASAPPPASRAASSSIAQAVPQPRNSPAWNNLRNSINKLAGVTNQMNQIQTEANRQIAMAQQQQKAGTYAGAPAGGAGYAYDAGAAGKKSQMTASYSAHSSIPPSRMVSQSPMITEYQAPVSNLKQRGMIASAPTLQGATNGTVGYGGAIYGDEGTTSGTVRFDQPDSFRTLKEYQIGSDNKSKNQELAKVALLPPAVISGIPQVRLGEPEHDAGRTIGTMGGVTKQQFNGWTIWSVKNSAQDTTMQLYVKHGTVEAMRIFDKSLMPCDLGVNLGDELTAVKTKFGEPTFILKEPTKDNRFAGQNYVYPLSQVSFQLARPGGAHAPRVVSMLIFNVNK